MDSSVHSMFSRPLRIVAAVFAVCAALLRVYILKNCLGEGGLPAAGSPVLLWTVLFSAVCAAVLLLLSLRLNRLPGKSDCLLDTGFGLFPLLVSALLIFFGSLFRMLDGAQTISRVERVTEGLGMVSAVCIVPAVLNRKKLGRAAYWLLAPLTVYTGATLLLRFRVWSHDPVLIDIVPKLLTMVCAMVTNALVPGFSLGVGHRRSTVFFGLATGVFAAMSLPDYLLGAKSGRGDWLIFLGLGVWAVSNALLLLRKRVQDEVPEPLPEEDGASAE